MDPQLWAWVDRVIYDSQSWSDFGAQMQRVETAQAEAKHRIVLCDLNWTRLVQFRLAIAQFFDHPAIAFIVSAKSSASRSISRPDYRSTALLLAGWLAAQLHWTLEKNSKDDALVFRDQAKKTIQVSLAEKAGEPIGRLCFEMRPARVSGGVIRQTPSCSKWRLKAPTRSERV